MARRSATERALELMEAGAAEAAERAEEGYLDLLEEEPESTGIAQSLMLGGVVPAIYERWWRPGWGRLFKGIGGPGMADEVRIARLLLGLSAGHAVLDVACGPGNFTRSFGKVVDHDGIAIGLDVSPSMLARAAADAEHEGVEDIAYVRAAATELPFRKESFEGVCCFGALYLIDDPEAALAEMRRVLKPGGRIALMTSLRRGPGLPLVKQGVKLASGLRLFERDEVTGELEALGFTEIHQRTSGLVQFVGARAPG